jgi:hypothetical protein
MFAIYLAVVIAVIYFISRREKIFPSQTLFSARGPGPQAKGEEIWKQVYETASMDEARLVLKRLEQESIRCILYEQGKKDIHGNPLKGVGVAVPSDVAARAQSSIAKMPV